MSTSRRSWGSAFADNLLTDNECSVLLEQYEFDKDLLKTITGGAPKIESDLFHTTEDELSNTLFPPSPPETKPSEQELADDLWQQFDIVKPENTILPNFDFDRFEEKTQVSLFDNITEVAERVEPPQPALVPVHFAAQPCLYAVQPAPQPTEELLREFDTVYGVVQLTHLTPPQSPPKSATQLLLSYAQQSQCNQLAPVMLVPQNDQWSAVSPSNVPVYDDSQTLEELVRDRAAQFASPPRSASPSPQTSPQYSPVSSPRSSPYSSPCSSSTDEEWPSSSRPKPYSRSTDDRRSRKKEQNKNAATRYRQKKKAENEVLLTEEHDLCQRHTELRDQCSDLQREIRYLKGLMRDLFKTKGLIK